MASSFGDGASDGFYVTYGASSGEFCNSTTSNKINFLSANIASGTSETTVPNANPIVVPGSLYAYSYEKWVRGVWTGSFSSITAINFWKQTGTLAGSVKIKALVKTPNPQTYVTAVATASTLAGASGNEATTTNDIPTATGTLQPAYNSGSTGTPAVVYATDYVVMQLVVPSGSSSGSIGTMTYRFAWNEV